MILSGAPRLTNSRIRNRAADGEIGASDFSMSTDLALSCLRTKSSSCLSSIKSFLSGETAGFSPADLTSRNGLHPVPKTPGLV
jgi:hypothetical protein